MARGLDCQAVSSVNRCRTLAVAGLTLFERVGCEKLAIQEILCVGARPLGTYVAHGGSLLGNVEVLVDEEAARDDSVREAQY
eukprot:scaffold1073_cov383-Prasinococcus_capsulatus_cf.AAC.2